MLTINEAVEHYGDDVKVAANAILCEGTWALPDTQQAVDLVADIVKAMDEGGYAKSLDELYKEIWNVYGNDSMMDDIDRIIAKEDAGREMTEDEQKKVAAAIRKHTKYFTEQPVESFNSKNTLDHMQLLYKRLNQ